MGNEAKCVVRIGRQRAEVQALLETNEIILRGAVRMRIPFAAMKFVKAVGGELRVGTAGDLLVLELGADAEKWAKKILNPKSRMEKLGVKTGARVALLGELDGELLRDLKTLQTKVVSGKILEDVEWVFWAANSKKELLELTKITQKLCGSAALWIVYPKGQKEITENDVLSGGRKAGLKDVKVVGFSATHTALKFVIPLSKR